MKELVLKAECPHGPGEIRVKLVADHYVGGNKLYLALWELTDNGPEPYGDLTKCLEGDVPADCAYVDTNNVPQAEQFSSSSGTGWVPLPIWSDTVEAVPIRSIILTWSGSKNLFSFWRKRDE